jgi:hypothetical protein
MYGCFGESISQMGTNRAALMIRRAVAILWSWVRLNYWTIIAAIVSTVAFTILVHLAKHDHRPPVGTYIAILGFVAAAVTFRKDPPVHEKFFWIIAITLLMTAEIQNLYKDRDEHTAQQSLISQNLGAQGQTLSGIAQNIHLSLQLLHQKNAPLTQAGRRPGIPHTREDSKEPAVINIVPAYGNLRERAIQLSQDLYGLLSKEQQDQQRFLAGSADASRFPEAVNLSVIRLSKRYFDTYDVQVRQIRDDFAKLNLRDKEIEEVMRDIDQMDAVTAQTDRPPDWKVNGASVLMVARGLTDLASKLPSN